MRSHIVGISGCIAVIGAGNAVAQSESGEAPQSFSAITVTDSSDAGTYLPPKRSSAATKTDTPLLETPMAVQSVPNEVLVDRRPTSTLEAIQNLSGVQTQQGTFYDQFQIRGFGSGYGVSYRNGLELEGIADAVNMSFVDRIEVVKGPASMLYGRVEPGGIVNVVTKKPQMDRATSIEQQVGSWNNARTTLDTTGRLNDERTAAYRVIVDYDKGDNYFDFDHHDRKALLAAVSFKPTARFDANFNVEYYDYKGAGRGPNVTVPINGNRPDPTGVSRSFSGSDPSIWAHFPDSIGRTLVAFDWNYALNDQWKLTQRFHYVRVREQQTGVGDWGTGDWAFIYNPLKREVFATNIDLAGTFRTGDIEHKLLFGIDSYWYKDDWRGYVGGQTGIPFVSPYTPGYVDISGPLRALANQSLSNVLWKSLEAGSGAYFQDQMSFGQRWIALLGVRYDQAYQSYSNTYGDAVNSGCYPNCTGQMGNWPSDKAYSPRAAALYKLDEATSLYASYAKSFGTNNSTFQGAGTSLKPEVGIQYELGAKASLLNDKVTASATLFDLTKQNILGPDPSDPAQIRQILIGEVNSRGLEMDLAGQVSQHVNLIASYTLDSVRLIKDTNGNQGNRKLGTPLQSASFWAKYDTSPGAPTGWEIGLGALFNGQRQGNDANTWQIPGYAKFDAMLAYRTKLGNNRLTAQLNVKNLFDRVYFDQIGYGAVAYGAPRSLTGSVKWEF